MERKTKQDLSNSLKEFKELVHNGNSPKKEEFEKYIDRKISSLDKMKEEDSPYIKAFYHIVEICKNSHIRNAKRD